MTAGPDNVALATAFVAAPSGEVFALVSDVSRWHEVFPAWIVAVTDEDDRFTATGVAGEMFDLYPHPDEEARALEVEAVDELGSADLLRLRLLDTAGGCFAVVSSARVRGMNEDEWERKRGAIAEGLAALGERLAG